MTPLNIAGISGAHLRQFIEKIERLESEKTDIQEAIRETFSEAKAEGFDVKVMRQLIKRRKMKSDELAEQEELLDLYAQAIGETYGRQSSSDDEAA